MQFSDLKEILNLVQSVNLHLLITLTTLSPSLFNVSTVYVFLGFQIAVQNKVNFPQSYSKHTE